MYTLRPDQKDLIAKIREAAIKGNELILCVAPTAFGKTVVFTTMITKIAKKGEKSVVLVHKDELVQQTAAKFPKHLKVFKLTANAREVYSPATRTHRITDGEHFLDECDVCIAMVLTFQIRNYDVFKNFAYLFADEVHLRIFDEPVKQWYNSRNGKKSWAFGFTATPVRLGKKRMLKEVWQCLVEGPPITQMNEIGALTPALYLSFKGASTEGLKSNGFDYSKSSHLEASVKQRFDSGPAIEETLIFMRRFGYWKKEAWPKMLMFCASIEQAEREKEILEKRFSNGNKFCDLIHGEMDMAKRKKIVQEHKDGVFPLLINIDILIAGYDDESLLVEIQNRKTKSLANFCQMTGRAVRKYEGKQFAIIVDLWGNCYEHGRYGDPTDDDIDWQYLFHKDPHDKALGAAPVKECRDDSFGKGCGAIINASATVCPMCNKDIEVKKAKEIVVKKGLEVVTGKEKNKTDVRYKTLLTCETLRPELLALVNDHYEKGWSFNRLVTTIVKYEAYNTQDLVAIGNALEYKKSWAFMQNKIVRAKHPVRSKK